MKRIVIALAAPFFAISLASGAVQAQTVDQSAHAAGESLGAAGDNIKHGAEDVGHIIVRGAKDVYEGGKAAVNAGSDRIHERERPHHSVARTTTTERDTVPPPANENNLADPSANN